MMFHQLSAAEISAYGAIIVAIAVPLGNFILTKYKNNFAKSSLEFNDGIEIRKELRKEVERLNVALDAQDAYYREELKKKDDVINTLRNDKYNLGVELASTKATLADSIEKVKAFKDKVIIQGEEVVEHIKSNAEINLK